MGKVFAQITMSLDGFVAAPNVGIAHPLGEGGLRLHHWLFGDEAGAPNNIDRQVAAEMFDQTGAFVIGRRMFDVGEQPWGEDGAFGMPVFVLTHRAKPVLVKGPTTFHFVIGGIEDAVAQARAAAAGKDICVGGGAQVCRAAFNAGLLDEFRIDIAPVLLGGGTRLFEDTVPAALQCTRVLESRLATHLRYDILRN